MAVTSTHANLQIIKWRKQVYREYRRGNLFSPYMSESPTAIIQVYRDLRDGGDQLIVPIVGGLNGPGVSTGPLTGNEEKLDQYGMRMWVDWSRNAVLLTRAQMRKSVIEQLELVRPLLTEWGQVNQRDEILQAFMALPSTSPPANLGNEATAGQRINGILWDDATVAQRDAWHIANLDRIQYGDSATPASTTVFATSIGGVTVTEKASSGVIMLAKRLARKANPGITPYRDNEDQGREWFVLFVGSNAFRDLSNDQAIINANLYARPREGNGVDRNPLFQDGDLLYRGIIIREIPELDTFFTIPINAYGASQPPAPVAPMFLCGQNAIAFAWGQMPRPTERKEDDYGFLIGRGVEMVYGVGKVYKSRASATDALATDLVQWGVFTIFVSSPADL
jgi:Protein of unknown function (DUF4043)